MRARDSNQLGFTLLELILVLGLVAMSAALAAPALGRFASGRQLQDQAMHLLAMLRHAQDQAILRASPHRLQVDTDRGTYGLLIQQNGAFAPPAQEMGRVFEIGPRLTLDWVGDAQVARRGYLQFEPDGGHDAAGLRLRDLRGRTAAVFSPATAEPFRVVLAP